MSSTTADLLGTIVAATERIVEVRAREVSAGSWDCVSAARRRLALDNRDLTVPRGIPRAVAASARGKSLTTQRVRTSRSLGDSFWNAARSRFSRPEASNRSRISSAWSSA